ncbi:unnamed protein product [Cylindrotheca closterium]|uniref:Uncharacterized protein n=1 Tax=Cylindrotheca closterium TaxID=2856 RepID=A0AAD2CV79_9STRA|nr:unnamed protein product [Cylindrotheca closterium]
MLQRAKGTHRSKRRKYPWLLYVAAILILSTGRYILLSALLGTWDSSQVSWSLSLESITTVPAMKKNGASFTIVVLGMDRFNSMKRLLDSLDATDYGSDHVDLVIRFDRPTIIATDGTAGAEWLVQVEEIRSRVSSTWKQGNAIIVVANEPMGLRRSWLEAWKPQDEHERAIILEDDVEVSPIWYRWLQQAHDTYGERSDLAGISLQRQTLIPKMIPIQKGRRNRRMMNKKKNIMVKNKKILESPKEGQPFLFRLVGSIGYSPKASVWMDFLDFANCALDTNLDVSVPDLITSGWYGYFDKTSMWTQLFIYFCNHQKLSTLYYFPPNNRVLAAHWREKGAHLSASYGRDFELATAHDEDLHFPSELASLDWDAKPIESQPTVRPLVMSVALHYGREEFDRFVLGLRKYYRGDIALLISSSATAEIKDLLVEHNVTFLESDAEGGRQFTPKWRRIIKTRYKFYQGMCRPEKYDACMILDFRDVLFQSNPLAQVKVVPSEPTLHVYLHNIKTNRWAKRQVMNCKGAKASWLEDQWFINAGGLIASPSMIAKISTLNRMFGYRCDDQIALNLAVYGKKLSDNSSIIMHKQGEGSINNAAWGGVFHKDSRRRILNHDCFPSPVVHQFDVIEKTKERAKLG